jgi:hypothetical protein
MTEEKAVEAGSTQGGLTPEEVIQIVRDMALRAPAVEPAVTASRTTRVKLARVEQELIDASLAAINALPEVQSALGRSDVDVRTEDADSVNWAVAIQTAQQFVDALGVSNGYRRQRVGLTAMQTYQICKSLAREPRHAEAVGPHLATIKRVVAKFRTKRQRMPETPAPQPAPQQNQ